MGSRVYKVCGVGRQPVMLLLVVALQAVGASPQIVSAPSGQYRGYELTSNSGRPFQAFSGIRYALPPVGHFRFQVIISLQRPFVFISLFFFFVCFYCVSSPFWFRLSVCSQFNPNLYKCLYSNLRIQSLYRFTCQGIS